LDLSYTEFINTKMPSKNYVYSGGDRLYHKSRNDVWSKKTKNEKKFFVLYGKWPTKNELKQYLKYNKTKEVSIRYKNYMPEINTRLL